MQTEQIMALDAVAARAMPAEEVVRLDGWLLRASALPAGRVNSVWPQADGEGPLPARLAEVERRYATLGRRASFQVSPAALPPGLDQALEARGYRAGPPVLVQTLPLHGLAEPGRDPAAGPASARSRQARAEPGRVTLRPSVDAVWLEVWRAAGGQTVAAVEAAAQMFGRVGAPSAFVTLAVQGVPAAVGRGVLDGGWLGIFAMATLPAARRRGAAAAVLAALLAWAREHAALGAYLQCTQENAAARSLYAGFGFTTAYAYHYRRPYTL